jgi:NADH-quinone oxidoreductase subunit H
MWIKYSLPRIRIDHMLSFNWKFLTPLALVIVMVTAVLDKLLGSPGTLVYVLGMVIMNILIAWLTLTILRRYVKLERKRVGEVRPVASPDLTPVSRV